MLVAAEVKPTMNIWVRSLSSGADAWGHVPGDRKRVPWAMAICQWVEVDSSSHGAETKESYPTLYVEGPKGGNPILDNIHGPLTVFLFLVMEFIPQSICLNGAFLYTMNHNEKEINKVPVCEWILFYKEMNCPYLGCFSSILTKQAICFPQPSWTTESLSWYIWQIEKSSSSFPEAFDDWAQSTRGWEKSKPGVYRVVPGTKKKWW